MNVDIHAIPLGIDRCYVVKGEGVIMIDAGTPSKAKAFLRHIGKTSIRPQDIKLLIITHGHFDHIGSAKAIKEITGAKIAMHELEKDWLEKSQKHLPPPATRWGRVFAAMISLYMPFVHIPATDVDIVLGNEAFPLAQFGIEGKIISTPGHSPGSVSIVLQTGEAFVGDLAMNAFPLRMRPGFPVFADDINTVKASWKKLLEAGAKTIYPAHGASFQAEEIC